MVFNWSEYLDLARFLKEQRAEDFSKEALYRCSISRAYYAAFCNALCFSRDCGVFQPSGTSEDHTLLREYLRKIGRVDVADMLDQLRQRRNDCDYDKNAVIFPIMVNRAIKNADSVITNYS